MSRLVPLVVGCVLPLTALNGCRDAGGSAPAVTVRDSAGIQIVENTTPVTTAPAQWTVSDSAVLSIGSAEEDSASLGRVAGAVRLTDGRLVIGDGQSGQLRFYGSDGTRLVTAGRKGKGPGEFGDIAGLWRGGADSIMAFDFTTRRLSVFDSSGKFVRHSDLTKAGFLNPLGALRNGTLASILFPMEKPSETTGEYRQPLTMVLLAPDGALIDTMAVFQGSTVHNVTMTFGPETASVPSQVQFGPTTILAVSPDAVYAGDNARYEIVVYDSAGRITRIIRAVGEARTVTPEDRAKQEEKNLAMMAQWGGQAPAEIKKQFEDQVRSARYAPSFPYFQALLIDSQGDLWVQDYQPPADETRHYSVFDHTGRLIARASLPPGVRPLHIDRGSITGLDLDEDDIPFVRVYPLSRE